MRRLYAAKVCLIAGIFLSLLFGSESWAQTQYDGSWSGTTAQANPISFTVSGGRIIRISVSCGSFTSTTTWYVSSAAPAITGNTFTYTSSGGSLPYIVSGTFASTTTATGTLSYSGTGGCQGTMNTTWTASRAGASAPTPIPTATYLTFIPHCVAGGETAGGYVTRIVLVNLSTSSNQVTINTIGQNGQQVGSSLQQQLSAGGSVVLTTGDESRFRNQQTYWLAVGSQGPVAATVMFDFRFATTPANQTISVVGVLGQSSGTSFAGPFMYQRDGMSDMPVLVKGLGIANRSDQPNTITVRLRDQSGTQLSSDTLSTAIPAFGQTAFTPSTLPNMGAYLAGRDTFQGSIMVTGTQAFIPVYVGNLGGRLFSLPLVSGSGSAVREPETLTVFEEGP